MQPRMFEEQINTGYNLGEHSRVSELEKLMKEILRFISEYFVEAGNSEGISAIEHFATRAQNISLSADVDAISLSVPLDGGYGRRFGK